MSIKDMMGLTLKIWSRGQCQCIESAGSSGGLACLWDSHKVVSRCWISSRSSLTLVASSLDTGEANLLTNVYAPSDIASKLILWSHNRKVGSQAPYPPWNLVGDFNVVLSMEEKRGRVGRLEQSSKILRGNIEALSLVDIRSSTYMFT